jgi:hypothetical protein
METQTILIILGVVILLILGLGGGWYFGTQRRSRELRQRFGQEYDYTVREVGDKKKAEEELQARRQRVESLNLRTLGEDERQRFNDSWKSVQAQFVDQPAEAVGEADRLVQEVMMARGFPVSDFEQRAADVSVLYPDLVHDYRAARQIADRNERGEADTEDLRQAMVHYRALFEELLETRDREVEGRTR